ncbi:hypothetical protein HPB47_012243 [Ixodes persulcatus]|uniref:Uncharacterized protein n=1 Tax=Ixodes persulcatus TaxID=34615 RepID=A0AC60NU51_IXOPE|nr:hypothetical protein HPB47_012243 [Ixodes persulcatus]
MIDRRTGHIRRDCRTPRCTHCHRFGHATEDCATTYASVARDRKDQEESEMFMDATEAEEVVQAVSQSTPSDERQKKSSTMASYDERVTASHGRLSKMSASGREHEGGREASGSGRTRPRETPSCAAEKGDQVELPGATTRQDKPMTGSNLAGKRQLDAPPDPDFLDETEQSSVPWEQQGSKKLQRVHKLRVPRRSQCEEYANGVAPPMDPQWNMTTAPGSADAFPSFNCPGIPFPRLPRSFLTSSKSF